MKGALLAGGTPTSIGSLPHVDAGEAARFVLRHQPVLPAAPSLPRRTPLEGMLAQAAVGIHGVGIGPDGSLEISGRLDPGAPVAPALDSDGFAGLRAFLNAAAGRTAPVKLQVTGPLTLGLALIQAGAPPRRAFPVAQAAVRARTSAVIDLARDHLPGAPLVLFLDEPSLTALGRSTLPLSPVDAVDLVSGTLAPLEPQVITGLHCCGTTDWRAVLEVGADVVSFPVDGGIDEAPGALAAHLEQGGAVAWGAVPTSGPVGAGPDRLWRRLATLWCDLVRAGCDPALLRSQSLITPECGLGLHTVGQAERLLRVVDHLAIRAADQALAARFSMGA